MVKVLGILCFILFIMLLFAIFFISIITNERKKEKLKQAEKEKNKADDILSKTIEEQKKTDELLEKTNGSCNTSNFNSSLNLLYDLSKKGKERNKTD